MTMKRKKVHSHISWYWSQHNSSQTIFLFCISKIAFFGFLKRSHRLSQGLWIASFRNSFRKTAHGYGQSKVSYDNPWQHCRAFPFSAILLGHGSFLERFKERNHSGLQRFSRRFCGKGNSMFAKTINVNLKTYPWTTQPCLKIKTNLSEDHFKVELRKKICDELKNRKWHFRKSFLASHDAIFYCNADVFCKASKLQSWLYFKVISWFLYWWFLHVSNALPRKSAENHWNLAWFLALNSTNQLNSSSSKTSECF